MAKLYFRYGAMNSGKSTAIIQVAHNYEERGMHAVLIKPATDTKGDDQIVSRLGTKRTVDMLVRQDDDIAKYMRQLTAERSQVHCILVDEVQFLNPKHINQLFEIAVLQNIPVICYGLRGDFQTNAFPGSRRLLEIAHSIEELKTICRCGKKAIFNGRKIAGLFVREGAQVAIDEGSAVSYESLCGSCYMQKVGGLI